VDGGEGQDAVFFVSCDVTSITMPVLNAVKEKMAKYPHIPGQNIVLNATHTHSSSATFDTAEKSPDGRDIYPGAKYREFFTDMIVEAVCEAWETRKEGGIAYGYGYAVVGHSRRVIYSVDQGKANPLSAAPNGFGVMYGGTNKPEFSHYEAGADHFLNAMYTFDGENRLTGIVANVPCPSQVTEHLRMLSADFWGDVRELMAEKLGPDVYILPQCAPAGDLAPRILHYLQAQARRMGLKYGMGYDVEKAKQRLSADDMNKRFAERKDIAERIVASVEEIYGWAKKDIITHARVKHHSWKQPFKRRTVTEEEMKACQIKLGAFRVCMGVVDLACGEHGGQAQVSRVNIDPAVGFGYQILHGAHMVKVAVGQKDCLHGQPQGICFVQNGMRFIAGVNDTAGFAVFFVDDVAVGLVIAQSHGVNF
jgi:hypothetical protein